MVQQRAEHEIEHGKKLSQSNPEETWGWGTPAGKLRAERRAQLIVDGAGLKPGIFALEIGCGTGLYTEKLSRSGAKILAVDISPDLLTIANQRNLPVEQVTFLEKRFEDCHDEGPFDAIVGSSILHHLDIATAMRQIHDLLKPGGKIAFAEPNMLNPVVFSMMNIPFIRRSLWYVSPDETAFYLWKLKDVISSTGFVDIKITPHDWLFPATPKSLVGFVRQGGFVLEKIPFIRQFAGSLFFTARRAD